MSGTRVSEQRRTSRARRHLRVRKKVTGTPVRPRMVINRSARHIYVQIVDATAGRTLVSASTLDEGSRGASGDKKARAAQVGKLVAERAGSAGIAKVVFDRGGNRYHGRIASLADAAREAGLEF
ncbi:MAG: 50S ribosomal protein L18 [Mycobacteriales bacterium]